MTTYAFLIKMVGNVKTLIRLDVRLDFLDLLKFYIVLISVYISSRQKIAILTFANRTSKIVRIAESKFSNGHIFIETVG